MIESIITPEEAETCVYQHGMREAEEISEDIRKGRITPNDNGEFRTTVSTHQRAIIAARIFASRGWETKIFLDDGDVVHVYLTLWKKR